MKPIRIIFALILFNLSLTVQAQIDANSVMGLPTAPTLTDVTSLSGFSQGNIIYIEDEDTLYFFDGVNWLAFLDTSSRDSIDNELFFEDVDYYYVSVIVNSSDWMVTRYDRTDINVENSAMGAGTQPADLTTVSGLTY